MQIDKLSHDNLVNFMHETTMSNPALPLLPSSPDFVFPSLTRELDILLTKCEQRKKLLLPELRNHDEALAVFSDYSGEHKDSKYYTYTFFATAHGVLFYFAEQMEALRREHFQDKYDKEISYKDIQWGGIKRSLKHYLRLVDRMPGLLLTVVVDKRIKSFFSGDTKMIRDTLVSAGLGEWKPSVAEKLLRVTHLVTYIIALLSKDGQKIFWMSDHDSIAESNNIHASKIVSSLLPDYGRKEHGSFGFATPFAERSLMYLDALSMTDLVAGAVQHYFTQDKITGGKFLVRNEDADITDWLGHQSFLKKHCVMFRYVDDANFIASNIIFEMTGIPENTIVIPISR
jgi:hypothetical protein